jgi:hypothetical protein
MNPDRLPPVTVGVKGRPVLVLPKLISLPILPSVDRTLTWSSTSVYRFGTPGPTLFEPETAGRVCISRRVRDVEGGGLDVEGGGLLPVDLVRLVDLARVTGVLFSDRDLVPR